MSNSEKNNTPGDDDGGWGDSEFASDHTTVDPTLLDRLAALDAKGDSGSEFPSESTVTLGMDDLLEMGSEKAAGDKEIPQPQPSIPSPVPSPPAPDPMKESPYGGPDLGPGGGERTQVFVPAMDDEPTRAKLRVVQGGGQQKEYMLARDRMTLGRGTNNDIMVPDIAISRQHVEILRHSDGSFKLRDMNSGNGSKLNGTRIIESDLFGGDRIEIGGTILEFVLTGPGASRSPSERQISIHPTEMSQNPSGGFTAPASNRNQNFSGPNYSAGGAGYNATVTHFQMQQQQQSAPVASRSSTVVVSAMIVFFGFVLVALVGFLIFYVVSEKNSNSTNTVAAKKSKSASSYFEEGVALSKSKSWDEAKDKFSIAMEIGREDRDFEVKLEAERQIERVLKEKSFQESLESARALMKKKEWIDVLAKLEVIRSHSVYYKTAREIVQKAQTSYADQEFVLAEKAFGEKRYDEADELVTGIIELVPTHKKSKELRAKILELPSDVHKPKPKPKSETAKSDKTWAERAKERKKLREKRAKAASDKLAAKSTTEKPEATKPKSPAAKPKEGKASADKGTANFAPGRTMYRNRKFAEAVKYFEDISVNQEGFDAQKASTLARSIKSFEQSFKKGTDAYKANNFSQATRYLSNAARLDKAISGSGGFFQGQLKEMLAESYYKQAQSAFNAHNYARAGSHSKKARGHKPGHPGVMSLFIKLEDKGKSMYIDAIKKKSSDPKLARRIAKSIVSMLPESSNTFKKAKKLLQEL